MAIATKLMHVRGERTPVVAAAADPSAPRLGALFERVLDAVVVARLSTGRIVRWNPAAERLFGYSAAEAIGQSIEILMPPAIAEVHRAGVARYQRTGRGLVIDAGGPVEMPARTRGGDEIRVELALSELNDDRGERFAVAIIRDATMRKQLELTNLELVQARVGRSELELELADRDELLDALHGMLQADPSPEDLQRGARAVAEFRQLHTGQLSLHMLDTDLVDIVHAATDGMRRSTPGRHVLVHMPPVAGVTCDPARMRQVLDQILEEATRRTREGGRIELRVDTISPHVVQVTLNTDAGGDARGPSPSLQLSRVLVQRQGGTFTMSISAGGSLEVRMTLPGSPHPSRHKPTRTRRVARAATISS